MFFLRNFEVSLFFRVSFYLYLLKSLFQPIQKIKINICVHIPILCVKNFATYRFSIKKRKSGTFQIQTQKIELKAQSKVGSLDNIKHKPGGGERKIFDDKDYLKNVEHTIAPTPPTQVNTM